MFQKEHFFLFFKKNVIITPKKKERKVYDKKYSRFNAKNK
jgi:hypothetical protein